MLIFLPMGLKTRRVFAFDNAWLFQDSLKISFLKISLFNIVAFSQYHTFSYSERIGRTWRNHFGSYFKATKHPPIVRDWIF